MVKMLFAALLALAAMTALPARHETKNFDSGQIACGDGTPLDSALFVVDTAKDAGVVDIERVAIDGLRKTRYVNDEPRRFIRHEADPVTVGSRAYYFRYKPMRKMLAVSRISDAEPEPLSKRS